MKELIDTINNHKRDINFNLCAKSTGLSEKQIFDKISQAVKLLIEGNIVIDNIFIGADSITKVPSGYEIVTEDLMVGDIPSNYLVLLSEGEGSWQSIPTYTKQSFDAWKPLAIAFIKPIIL